MLKIYEAASSEFGSKWGEPGNQLRHEGQLDGELRCREWEDNGWTAAFHILSNEKRKEFSRLIQRAVACPLIGYAQWNNETELTKRTGYYNELVRTGANFAQFKPCNCDCSSFVCGTLAYLGFSVGNDLTTAYIDANLCDCPGIDYSHEDEFLRSQNKLVDGDILLKNGHVCVVCDPYIADQEPLPEKDSIDYWRIFCVMKSGKIHAYELTEDGKVESV